MDHPFIYGVILALGLIFPLGVQNVFIFNQGATQSTLWRALPSVLTAFFCDLILIMFAVIGLSLAILAIAWLKILIFFLGFFFLMYMGYSTWTAHPNHEKMKASPLSTKKQIAFALSVSLFNPHAIIDTIGVIGTNSLNFIGYEKIQFTLACLLVSLIWFFGLSFAGHCLGKLNKTGLIYLINKLSALIIWSVGIYIGYQLIKLLFGS